MALNCHQETHHRFSLLELILLFFVAVLVLFTVWFAFNRVFLESKVDRRPDRQTCHGNLYQIGVAVASYSEDNEGWLPKSCENDLSPLSDGGYLTSMPALSCPSTAPQPTLPSSTNYWYVGSGLQLDGKSNPRIAFDMYRNHNHKWMNVLFLDGSVKGAVPNGDQGWNENRSAQRRKTGYISPKPIRDGE